MRLPRLPSKWTKKKKFITKLLVPVVIANLGFTFSKSPVVVNICYAIAFVLLIIVLVLMIVWRGKIDLDREDGVTIGEVLDDKK